MLGLFNFGPIISSFGCSGLGEREPRFLFRQEGRREREKEELRY